MDNGKKSINCEKVRFQFCSKGVERESGITQVHRERVPHGRRGVIKPSWAQCLGFSLVFGFVGSWDVGIWFVGRTVVGPTSWMNACCRDRQKLKPERTDRIGNRELDHGGICRRGEFGIYFYAIDAI